MKSVTGYNWAKANKTRQLMAELSKPRRNKFGAVKVDLDGISFDSKAEARHYSMLKLREKAGEIFGLKVHHKYPLIVNDVLIATYEADFVFRERLGQNDRNGALRVQDVKSPPTAKKRDFVLIKKLMKAVHGIEVEVMT